MPTNELEELMLAGTDEDVVARYASLSTRAQDARFGLDEDEVVILDTETSGLNPMKDEIIEIAAAIMKGPLVVSRFSTFVNPQRPISKETTKLTGITNEMLEDAPTIDVALRDFATFVGSRDMIAHNAPFDRAFIMRHARPAEFRGDWIDSVELARIALPRLKAHNLPLLAGAFKTATPKHRAIDDVEALCGIWRILLVALSDFPEGLLSFIASLHPATSWPLRKVITHIAAATPEARFSLRVCRDANTKGSKLPVKNDASGSSLLFPTKREIRECFAKDSIVGAMYPGYEPREEQVLMAEEIVEAFETCTFRAIEAGTGVGKSIAYLLPAALSAKRNSIGIGVATKTNALMDQLVYYELPRLAKTLPGGLNYVALKGYEHYPCLRKLERFAKEETDYAGEKGAEHAHAVLSMLATLYAFIGQSSWGDLDSINLYWKDLPKNQISALPGDCTHTHCSFFPTRCFLHGLRQRAKSADIVVTNHALLFRDVVAEGGILPPIRHWIIDEAHSAEDEARKQLSPSIDVRDLKITLDALYQSPSSTLASLRRKAVKADGGQIISVAIAKAEEQARSVDVIAESFFSFVKDLENLAEKSEYDYVDLWVNSELRESGPWGVVVSTGHSLEKRMQKLIELCKETLDLLEASSGELADLRAELLGMIGRLYEMREALVLCVDGEDKNYAYWARLNRHPDRQMETLTSSLLDVGEAFLESFYPRVMSVVYTSATIATGDSFEHFAHGVGLDRLEDGKWKSLRLDSSYDFENNMVIYVPTDIPSPNEKGYRAAFNDLLFDVHVAMGGSVLTLFTNRREMEYAYESLDARLAGEGINLICQMKGMSAKRLRDEFIADEKASLFALRSFWEGFDAPGDTLRCVIISRLPFSRPNDPLTLERSLRERNAWSRYALPEAIIDLKQAAGRLIRSSSDKGFLVLADSRLITKGYGKKFLSAMPSQAHFLLPSEELSRNISERLLSDGNSK